MSLSWWWHVQVWRQQCNEVIDAGWRHSQWESPFFVVLSARRSRRIRWELHSAFKSIWHRRQKVRTLPRMYAHFHLVDFFIMLFLWKNKNKKKYSVTWILLLLLFVFFFQRNCISFYGFFFITRGNSVSFTWKRLQKPFIKI